MKKPINILFLFALLVFACSSDSPNSGSSDPIDEQTIIPSELNLEIIINGESSAQPYGDGSGSITCIASANDAINYEFRFGGGITQQSEQGQVEYSFNDDGVKRVSIAYSFYNACFCICNLKLIFICNFLNINIF